MKEYMPLWKMVDRKYCDIADLADHVLVPVGNAIYNFYARTWPGRFRKQVEDAIDRGISFFEQQETLTFDAIGTFLLMINTSYEPRLDRFDEKIRAYAGKWNDPHLRLLDEDYDPESGVNTAKEEVNPNGLDMVEKPLVDCLYADRAGIDEKFLQEIEALEDDGGYGTTHKLLAAVILKKFSAIPGGVLDGMIESAISNIAKAQRRASAADIFFERTVLLQWLDRDHFVDPAWIVRILRAQLGNGGWRWDRSFRRRRAEQHPSCCGLTALIQFREKRIKGGAATAPKPSELGRAFPLVAGVQGRAPLMAR